MTKVSKLDFVHVELKKDSWGDPGFKVRTQEDAVDVIKTMIQKLDRERVIQLNLATSGRVINASVVSIGSHNASIVDPQQVLRTALLSGAPRFILFHNHPSGDALPSQQDREVARRLAAAAGLVGLTMDDFIIIGDDDIYSMSDYDSESLQPDLMVAE